MKFEVGDKVVVKFTNEDGVVRQIIDDHSVLVEVKGVRFPANTQHLDFPYFKMFTEQRQAAKKPDKKYIDDIKKEKPAPRYQVAPGVWLLMFPKFAKDVFGDEQVDSLKLYLVNQTPQGMVLKFWFKLKGEVEFELDSTIAPLADFYLLDFDFDQLNDGPAFDFEFSLQKPDKQKADYFEAGYRPKAKQLFKQVAELQESGGAFVPVQLFEAFPAKTTPPPEPFVPSSGAADRLKAAGFKVVNSKAIYHDDPPPPTVLDLHIEKLTDSYSHMLPHEKLVFQLNALEKWLDKLQLHFVKQAVIIHGVGSGKLRDEVHQLLNHKPNVKSFVQQYHPWYGNGATEVFFA
jgi:hypothetical protein